MRSLDVYELNDRLEAGENPVILDVREPHEWEIASLERGIRIPKGDIQAAKNAVLAGRKLHAETVLSQIPKDQEVIVYCRTGKRSADVIHMLSEIGYDTEKLVNLEGGIVSWAREIDPSLPVY